MNKINRIFIYAHFSHFNLLSLHDTHGLEIASSPIKVMHMGLFTHIINFGPLCVNILPKYKVPLSFRLILYIIPCVYTVGTSFSNFSIEVKFDSPSGHRYSSSLLIYCTFKYVLNEFFVLLELVLIWVLLSFSWGLSSTQRHVVLRYEYFVVV